MNAQRWSEIKKARETLHQPEWSEAELEAAADMQNLELAEPISNCEECGQLVSELFELAEAFGVDPEGLLW